MHVLGLLQYRDNTLHAVGFSMRQQIHSACLVVGLLVLASVFIPDMQVAVPVVILLSCCCTLAVATAQADFGALVGLPRVRAVPRNVTSLLALVAQHCSSRP